jgi:hypothetical protein
MFLKPFFRLFLFLLIIDMQLQKVIAENNGKVLAKDIPHEVQYALTKIRSETLVPIIVPTVMPRYDIAIVAGGRVDKVDADDAYEIFFGTTKECNIEKCSFGKIRGELISSKTDDPLSEYQSLLRTYIFTGRVQLRVEHPVEQGGYVVLSKGIKGFYIPAFCTKYCGNPKVVWRQNKYQYYVSISTGEGLKELVKIANSAIDNQP